MEEPVNLSGAIIFWLYIAAALGFTAITLSSISSLPIPSPPKQNKDARIFSVLALLSFISLSFNMLHVLIQSFTLWSKAAHQSINATSILTTIGHWSTTTALFRDFGQALVADDSRYIWALSSLWITFSICVYIGAEGKRRSVPNLWAFFALSQILPISFAQNLFYVALLRSPTRKGDDTRRVEMPVPLMFGVVGAYCGCLYFAREESGGDSLIQIILMARSLLALPMFVPEIAEGKKDEEILDISDASMVQILVGMFAAAQIAAQLYSVDIGGLPSTLISHPAITSLGFDGIMSIVSFLIWQVRTREVKSNSGPY